MPRNEQVINVALRADLWSRAKAVAALEKRPVKYLLEDALAQYLARVEVRLPDVNA